MMGRHTQQVGFSGSWLWWWLHESSHVIKLHHAHRYVKNRWNKRGLYQCQLPGDNAVVQESQMWPLGQTGQEGYLCYFLYLHMSHYLKHLVKRVKRQPIPLDFSLWFPHATKLTGKAANIEGHKQDWFCAGAAPHPPHLGRGWTAAPGRALWIFWGWCSLNPHLPLHPRVGACECGHGPGQRSSQFVIFSMFRESQQN